MVSLFLPRMLVPLARGSSVHGYAGGGGLGRRVCRCALPHGLEHGFPKILEPEDQLQVHAAGLHDLGRKRDVSRLESRAVKHRLRALA